jgi:trimeric autotransporter adhesin
VSENTRRAWRYFLRISAALPVLLLANVALGQNTISTVAGSAPPNNVAPTAATATLEGPQSIVRDPAGNFYVITDAGVIFKITPGAAGVMTIYAGNNTAGFSPNGTAAGSTLTWEPYGAAVDGNGNLYYSDSNNCVVREIVAGAVKTVAGNGNCGFGGDGGAATSASLGFLQGIALDSSGNLFIADYGNSVIRKVDSAGTITTYAGLPDNAGYSGDGEAASSAQVNFPEAVAVDASGNLFIADSNNNVIRRVDVNTKIITTVAGTSAFGYSGDGGLATEATMEVPDGVAVDAAGNLYISDTENAVIREVFSPTSPTTPNVITTIVGNHGYGFSGDGGLALSAEMTNPAGLFVDPATGNLWIADFWTNRVRLYTASSKMINTVFGSGQVGDGGPATSASMYFPRTPGLDAAGDLFIVDAENNRIREVDTTGKITTVVGTGIPCAMGPLPCGDGGLATDANIFMPRTVTIEASGDMLVSDNGDSKIREVDHTSGNITTVVGAGTTCGSNPGQVPWPCGDGGPALSASLNDARGAVRDAAGNLYFVDAQDNRVREVNTAGIISTVAGDGPSGTAPTGCPGFGSYTGDGGPASIATLNCPLGLDIDASGNLFVADTQNNVIRKIDTSNPRIITTVVGTGAAGYTGDGGSALSATLNSPDRVSLNGAGNLFISDSNNNVIRRVDGITRIIKTFAGNGNFTFAGDGGPALSASFEVPVGVVVGPQGNLYVGDLYNNRIRKVVLNPNVNLSVTTAPFGNEPISGSTMLPVTVTNSGDAPLTISSIAHSGDLAFSIASNPCPATPATLAVGANCILQVAFAPTQFIAYTGTITITDDGPTPGSTQTVSLTGMGAASLTVTATGNGKVSSSPVGITNCAATCSATFAGNSEVVLTATAGTGATFSGWSGGGCMGTGTCTVTMSANETVTATFVTGGATISISPAALTFGSQAVGTTSAAQTVTVSNTGNSAVTFTSIVTSGDFAGAATAQCPSIAFDAAPCVFQITFKPTATGTRTGTITFTDNATGSPQTVNLTGTGAAGTGTISIAPTALTFASQNVGTTSAAQTVTVSNTGNSAVTFTSIVTSGDFAGATTAQCPSIAVDAAPCVFQITFKPTATGTRTGTIAFTDNATGSPQTVTLTGTGTGSAATIGISPTSLTFASQNVGTTSASQAVTVSNNGGVALTFTSIVTSGDFAGATTAQCTNIPVEGEPCVFSITFTPTATGTRTGTITFTDNATGSPQTVTLTGTGASGTPTVTVTPSSLNFPGQALTTTSAPQTVTVKNTGTAPVNISAVGITEGSFAIAAGGGGTCASGTSLTGGASCTIGVTFTPAEVGPATGTLSVTDNATGSPQMVALSGTGVNEQVIITIPSGGSATATANPGGTAYFGLEITAATGVSGTVTLGCIPSTPTITCNAIPSTVPLNGKPVEAAFGIQTFCQGTATSNGLLAPGGLGGGGIGLLLVTLIFGGATWIYRSRRRVAMTFATLLLVAVGSAACNSLPQGPNGVTPAGTYTLTLTTTLNSQTQTFPNFLTLVVK